MTAQEKTQRLNRMQEIVNATNFTSTDVASIRELINLANHPDFTGMDHRRARLQSYLGRLEGLTQRAAIEKWWDEIRSTVHDFHTEIQLYRH